MAESAAVLLEDDERLNFRLVDSSDHVQLHPPRRFAVEWQRLVYYMIGGIVSLGSLLLLAEQINPPDSALRGQAMVQDLGAWDGVWRGKLTRFSLSGGEAMQLETRREYFSSASDIQSASVVQRGGDGTLDNQIWVYRIGENGDLTAQRADKSAGTPFRGQVQGRRVIWVRQGAHATEIITSWIHNNELFIQEQYIPTNSTEGGWILAGQLERE